MKKAAYQMAVFFRVQGLSFVWIQSSPNRTNPFKQFEGGRVLLPKEQQIK